MVCSQEYDINLLYKQMVRKNGVKIKWDAHELIYSLVCEAPFTVCGN